VNEKRQRDPREEEEHDRDRDPGNHPPLFRSEGWRYETPELIRRNRRDCDNGEKKGNLELHDDGVPRCEKRRSDIRWDKPRPERDEELESDTLLKA